MLTSPYHAMKAVARDKTVGSIAYMLLVPPREITRYSGVQNAVPTVRHHVHKVAHKPPVEWDPGQPKGFRDDAATNPSVIPETRERCPRSPYSILKRAAYKMLCPVFAQSDMKASMPLSVSGCFARPFKTAGGTVATSAPMMAACLTWFAVRTEAARISVSSAG